ncbi:MAG: carboxypeptidase-like regulatory domain-containing protein [Lachnospiraceae bacterium]|nr:carboxypeptidase-like regulatory domain-containing protein [Lachnospiraceae bacterium]
MKRKLIQITIIAAMIMLTACGKTEENIISNKIDDESVKENTLSQSEVKKEVNSESVNTVSNDKTEHKVPTEEITQINFETKVKEDTFENALAYITEQKGKMPAIDYSLVTYLPENRDTSLAIENVADEIDAKIGAYSVKKIRMLRTDNHGSTIDFTVYTNPGTKKIDKIISTEYCSDGRDITNFYFNEGSLSYVYSYKDNIYGTSYKDGTIRGKKCYFAKSTMVECYINDEDALKSNKSYTAKDYKKYDEFIQSQYDELEKDLINRAYTTYMAVKDIPGTATISGYVADEYGGILSNVKMTITSKSHKYSSSFVTNGDGYFETQVPVNNEDWYGVELKYGDFKTVTINDIYIPTQTISYSLGITYMAAEGENKHDTDYYLLDVTKNASKRLKDNEYQIVLTYDNTKAELQPFMINLGKEKKNTDSSIIVSVDKDTQFKYYVTDKRGGNSDNTMTYEMSTSEAQVKVYNKDGLVASYQVPVNKAGVVWEVFEINGTTIVPVDNYYYDVGKEVFFE